jgi:hypothetical protein
LTGYQGVSSFVAEEFHVFVDPVEAEKGGEYYN